MYDGSTTGNPKVQHNWVLPQRSYSIIEPALNVSSNGLIATIPKGYMLDEIIVAKELAGDIEVNFGITPGGNEIAPLEFVLGANANTYSYNFVKDISISEFEIYVSSPAWGGAVVNIYFSVKKVK